MNIDERIDAFSGLGRKLNEYVNGGGSDKLEAAVSFAYIKNGWFVKPFVIKALQGISMYLDKQKLKDWIDSYSFKNTESESRKKVGVIMPGNIPAAGFFDALCVLISGNDLIAKTSSDDEPLMKQLLQMLTEEDERFKERIVFGDFRVIKPDAVIATGSNNTARYFEYYFEKYPNIIRKNRNSVAVLSGNESKEELDRLADDVFTYFGLGCRNVSKVFIPKGYDTDKLFNAFFKYSWVVDNKKYGNNYDYNKTILMLNKESILENGFLLIKRDIGVNSPMATLFVEEYDKIEDVKERLRQDSSNLQCVVSSSEDISEGIPFGTTQLPGLMDYPDKVDVMRFLERI